MLQDFNTEFEAATPDAGSAAARFERMLSGDEVVVVVAPSPVLTSPAGDSTGAFALINVDAADIGARRFHERLGWSHLDPDSGSLMLCYLREL